MPVASTCASSCTLSSPNAFQTVVILDASGSMSSIKGDMLGSLNTFIGQQQTLAHKEKEPAFFTLVQFNDEIKYVRFEQAILDATRVGDGDYITDGFTALYDAIGQTLEKFDGCPKGALVIITDGRDNSSKRFNQATVKAAISKVKEKPDWSVTYMSQNVEGSEQGAAIGIVEANNITCNTNSFGATFCSSISERVGATYSMSSSGSRR